MYVLRYRINGVPFARRYDDKLGDEARTRAEYLERNGIPVTLERKPKGKPKAKPPATSRLDRID